MGRRIELPQLPKGQTQEQLQALYSYLYRMAEALNNNLAEIGNGDFTDEEMVTVREITGETGSGEGMAEAETLKSLIIKTAQLIKSEIDAYNLKLVGTYEADGKLGRYVRKTRLDVDVTPTGITQNYTFESIVQGLKTYEVNAKNYIKTGLLRTVSDVPVYGVAIGKDVVTFSDDGTETYNDGNKVAELTADELSFWQNGNKVASYTGNKISFYSGGSEVMYIQGGKIYVTGDLEIESGNTFKIVSGGAMDVTSENLYIKSQSGAFAVISDIQNIQGEMKYQIGNGIINTKNYTFNATVYPATFVHNEGQQDEYRTCALCTVIKDRLSRTGKIENIDYTVGFYNVKDWDTNTVVNAPGIIIENHSYDISTETYTDGKTFLEADWLFGNKFVRGYTGYFTYIKTESMIQTNILTYTTLNQQSSKEIKHDIRDMEPRGEALDRLRPVTFVYDEDPAETVRAGLIYEEAAEVLPEICTGDESSKAINYVELIPMLLKEIQELRARVKALEEREGGQ